jgi:hypothetical protein
LSVVYFVFGLVLLFAVDRLSTKMRSAMEFPPAAVESFESSLQLVVAHGDAQIAALRAEMYLVIQVLIVAGIGTALFAHAVSEWRRDRRDRLVVKLLRQLLLTREVRRMRANQITGANSRAASPLEPGRQSGSASCSPPSPSAAVAQFYRSAAEARNVS